MSAENQPKIQTVAALITARGGSKGLPGKNIRNFAGKPLIAYSIEAAQQSRSINAVYLSSDDPDIISVAMDFGCDSPFVRSPELSSDHAASLDVVLDALDRLPYHDIWVLLQPTSPLRTSFDIDAVVKPILEGKTQSAVAVREADDHPYLCFMRTETGTLSSFCNPLSSASLRRQDLPKAYVINGAAYALTPDWLRTRGRFVDEGSAYHVMPRERSVDIDTIEDFEEAEKQFKRQRL